ncbi:MAG: Bug family tripartite tricarboxylate transporter substrate binding protein [Lautropia sp.]
MAFDFQREPASQPDCPRRARSRPARSARRLRGLLAAAALACSELALAAFPTGPVKLIVPYPPGGAVDVIGRALAPLLERQLGQPVVTDNRPGAAGVLGMMLAVNAKPDGYTLVVAANSHVAADPGQEQLPYQPTRDLTPVAPLVSVPYVVVANPQFPPNTIAELLEAARKAPGQINFASSGIGGPPHMASELLLAKGKVDIRHIPYKGAAPAFADVVGGQVQFITGDVNSAMPYLKSGRLKALATTGKSRLPQLPDVPTVAESGLPGYQAEGWFAVYAPARMPADVLATLTRAVETATASDEFKSRMAALGGSVMAMSPQAFQAFVVDETRIRSELIRSNGIKLEK